MKTKLLLCLFVLLTSLGKAQEVGPQMADQFREQGKIYVVISVIAIIFLSLVFFLIYLERKLKRLEKELEEKNKL
ncbi:MAG: CcmD family protein [Bacteroidia bacterium]|jgi:CcmD family protein|nr:CcmD family protein [Bacteroidia bacterium]